MNILEGVKKGLGQKDTEGARQKMLPWGDSAWLYGVFLHTCTKARALLEDFTMDKKNEFF